MSLVDLQNQQGVYTLVLQNEGKFNDVLLADINAALDEVEALEQPAVIIITGEGKVFSQGYDLAYLMGLGDAAGDFVNQTMHLLGRLLSLGIPTVAAVNGHAFGLGAMLAMACDFRIMRSDRGYFCLPEIDLKMGLHPVMNMLLKQKLSATTFTEALLTGKRYGGEDAAAAGIVNASCVETELMTQANSLISNLLGKDKATYGLLKQGLNDEILQTIEQNT